MHSSSNRTRQYAIFGVVLAVVWGAGFWWLFANPPQASNRATDEELQQQILAAVAQAEAQPKRLPLSKEERRIERNELLARLKDVDEMSSDERRQLIEEYAGKLQGRQLVNTDMVACNLIVRAFEKAGDHKLAAATLRRFADVLLESGSLRLYMQASFMQGAARQYELFEKPMELSGITTEGKPFDWKQYRGKIVLVEFWSIACPGCRELVPFMKRNYAEYHQQGFEIVGVCLDKNREQVANYVRKNEIPWATVLEDPAAPPHVLQLPGFPRVGAAGPNQKQPAPFAPVHYGVVATPTMLLLDKQGKLMPVKLEDGAGLTRQLAAIFDEAPRKQDQNSDSETGNSGE